MRQPSDKVRFNVGGKIFETTATTFSSAGKSCMFGVMFDDELNVIQKEVNEEIFIDRNPDCFSALLDFLRTGLLVIPPHVPEKLLYREALHYGLLDHVRTAKESKLDVRLLELKSSVRDQARNSWTAVRASPDGGCAVADGGVVRIYDWVLSEHPPLNLDYQSIKDIGWIDLENIVLSSSVGGMGLFSSSTGDLKNRYKLNLESDQAKSFSAGALCFNPDGKIFASCKGTSSDGIGVWDQLTGKQTDFFETADGLLLGDADKIQWLNGRNLLFVSKCLSESNKNYISLLDVRDRSIVWSGTSKRISGTNSLFYVDDAIPVDEEGNSVCVASKSYDGLGFLDLRRTDISIRWSNLKGTRKNHLYPSKLAFHEGQLFLLMDGMISMYCRGPDEWSIVGALESSPGYPIRDFSIGGDRLFALHSGENVFDIWQTPVRVDWELYLKLHLPGHLNRNKLD